jgi:hypothetical protein
VSRIQNWKHRKICTYEEIKKLEKQAIKTVQSVVEGEEAL